jgi:hypothetical protein
MFLLDFKPQFYSYPLDDREYARIKVRALEVQAELARLESEANQISSDPKYMHFLSR